MVTPTAARSAKESAVNSEESPALLWRDVRLTDVARLESGHTPSKRRPEYWDGTIQWLSLHDVDALGHMRIWTTARTVTEAGIANSSARILPAGTVAFSRTATVGKAVILGVPMATSQDFACYVCGPEVHNGFLVHLFRSMGHEWKKLMAGSIHNTIYMPVFRELSVRLPPPDAQRAIAEALSDADALIEGLERLIAKKRAIKRGAMQDLLSGRKRLPGFSGAWAIKPLGEICQVLNGLTYSPSDVRQAGTLVLRSSNIQDDVLSFENNVFVEMTLPPNVLVEENDILVCVRNGSRELIGKCAKITSDVKGAAFGAFMAVLRSPLHSYLLHQFRSGLIKRQIAEHLGATINQITNKSLKSFSVSVPNTVAEADAIALALSDMEAEIDRLSARLSKARLLKQGMAQELLTGRVRLV